jgi:putative membrane protein
MDRRLIWLMILLAPVLGWSAVGPHDRFTWFLEVAPIFIGLPIVLALQKRLPLSSLLLVLLWWHSVILILGGHYTYARVPLGDWAMDWFGWSRNNYDKVGHFAQGFVPAILVRELLLRTSPLGGWAVAGVADPGLPSAALAKDGPASARPATKPSKWLPFLCGSVCLAFSAFYELIEWWVAVASGGAADDFLGTQGYVWDTQSDMGWALGGAIIALILMVRWHDRSMARLASSGR